MVTGGLAQMVATEQSRDLRARADGRRGRRSRRAHADGAVPTGEVSIRWAGRDDGEALGRLAALDAKAVPAQPVLLAELDGEPVAALSVADRSAVADPFRPTGSLVSLLALRADQLARAGGHRRRAGRPLLVLAR